MTICVERREEIIPPLLILGAEDSTTEEEIEAYRRDHPRTRVVVLTRKDCGSDVLR